MPWWSRLQRTNPEWLEPHALQKPPRHLLQCSRSSPQPAWCADSPLWWADQRGAPIWCHLSSAARPWLQWWKQLHQYPAKHKKVNEASRWTASWKMAFDKKPSAFSTAVDALNQLIIINSCTFKGPQKFINSHWCVPFTAPCPHNAHSAKLPTLVNAVIRKLCQKLNKSMAFLSAGRALQTADATIANRVASAREVTACLFGSSNHDKPEHPVACTKLELLLVGLVATRSVYIVEALLWLLSSCQGSHIRQPAAVMVVVSGSGGGVGGGCGCAEWSSLLSHRAEASDVVNKKMNDEVNYLLLLRSNIAKNDWNKEFKQKQGSQAQTKVHYQSRHACK